MDITDKKLFSILKPHFPNAKILCLDRKYSLRSELNDVKASLDAFRALLKEGGLARYVRDKRDCDDFAWWYRGFVVAAYGRAYPELPGSMATGFMIYESECGGKHAINFEVLDGSVVYVEPQRDSRTGILKLSDKERKSVTYAIV